MVEETSQLTDSVVSQSKDPPECCSRSANHVVRRCWAWEPVVSSCCHVGGGGVGGELPAYVARRDSDPAVAGQTAHPLTRRANRHCCSVLVVYEAIRCCLPRRRCFVHARSFTGSAQWIRDSTSRSNNLHSYRICTYIYAFFGNL
jgi:hypothetical protein